MMEETLHLSPSSDEKYIRIYPVDDRKDVPSVYLSLKNGGDMGPSDSFTHPNRIQLLRNLSIDPDRVHGVKQIHSRKVLFADQLRNSKREDAAEADGLVTCSRDDVLAVTVADCLPVFLVHRGGRCFAALHSGWKGTGIITEALSLLQKHASVHPEEIDAVIGPGIGPCCYHVDRERADYFKNNFGTEGIIDGEPPSLDLRAVNRNLLRRAGVHTVLTVNNCTCCTPWLSSYRREGASSFTRMIALIGHLV